MSTGQDQENNMDTDPGEDIANQNPVEDIENQNPRENVMDRNPNEGMSEQLLDKVPLNGKSFEEAMKLLSEMLLEKVPWDSKSFEEAMKLLSEILFEKGIVPWNDKSFEEVMKLISENLLERGILPWNDKSFEEARKLISEKLLELGFVPSNNFSVGDTIQLIMDVASTIFGFGCDKGGCPGGSGGSGRPPAPTGSGGGGGDKDDSGSNNVTLSVVGGLDEHIMYLRCSVIFPMTNPEALKPWGVSLPKGLMFHGAPGTGKTLIAKAIANEISKELKTRVPFYYHKGADCLGKYFGESEENLRAIFKKAVANKPSILFFDEIDGLCPNRDNRGGGEAYASVVTAFLGLMDTIKNGEVLVIGATNLIDSLDPAVRRPGRFDKELVFHPPDEQGRNKIIQIHTDKWKTASKPSDQILKNVSSQTQGFTGAYLENLCKEALNAALERERDKSIGDQGFDVTRVVVEEEDWAVALSNMERPNPKIFGSNLHVAIKNQVTEPLLVNLSSALKLRIDKVSPMDPECQFMLKSMLVWDNVETSNYDIENFMIPEILNQPGYQKMPVYELNGNNIANMNSVFRQVHRSPDPCVLYIPRLNQLWDTLQHQTKSDFSHLAFVLLNNLKMTRGHPVLVLATSNVEPLKMSQELNQIFRNSFKMRKANDEERDNFFKCYRCEKLKDVEKLLEEIVRLTSGSNLERLVNIHSRIHGIYQTQKTEKDVHTQMEVVVQKLRVGNL